MEIRVKQFKFPTFFLPQISQISQILVARCYCYYTDYILISNYSSSSMTTEKTEINGKNGIISSLN
jgi:hypothetical protein